MKVSEVFISGCASWLPPAVPAEAELTAGRCSAADVQRTGMCSVTVAGTEAPAEMAARAAERALSRAGCEPDEVGLVLYASLYDQGHDLWSPASYVQRAALGGAAEPGPAMEIRQVSNGGMAAIELAVPYLKADPRRTAALLSTGDVFCLPGFDRWRTDPGTVYADGGAALVLSRTGGFAELLGMTQVSEPRLEGMHRGLASAAPDPDGRRRVVDLDRCKNEYLTVTPRTSAIAWSAAGQRRALTRLLTELDLELDDIARFVLPHLGARRLSASYFAPFGIPADRSTWPWSRTVGHLGAGDQFAGLAHLVETRQLRPGDLCLLAGVGAGFSWSCAVLRVLDVPDW